MMIDVYTHILPPKYLEERNKRAGAGFKSQYAKYPIANPGLTSLDIRFRIMDKFKDLVHVLTIAGPNVESITSPKDAVELAMIANDEMAELVMKYPDRFVGAVACLPMNDVNAALKEADRTINELKFKGIEIFTDINGKPVDSPEFWPFYEKMEQCNLPVLLHPRRENTRADYAGEWVGGQIGGFDEGYWAYAPSPPPSPHYRGAGVGVRGNLHAFNRSFFGSKIGSSATIAGKRWPRISTSSFVPTSARSNRT